VILDSQPWELNMLRGLQPSYEARGLKFHINPSRALVPPFLSEYLPDAIAVSPDGGGIIIEVTHHRTQATNRQLAELAKKVADQKGWQFQAIYVNPSTETPDNIANPTPEQIDANLQEMQVLADTGHYAPALIFGWAILESLARLAGTPRNTRGYSPIQAVQALAEEGYIENEEAQSLREMARLRSAVVHGDFSVNVSAEQVEFLFKQLNALRNYILKVAAEQGSVSASP
jgi:REase_AHJR-like protein/ribonuclease HepT-like protein